MSEKQKKTIIKLDVIELLLSIIGFITSCLIFALTMMNERYFFYFIAVFLGFNIIHMIKKIEKETAKPKIVKYSKKLISMKKVSY